MAPNIVNIPSKTFACFRREHARYIQNVAVMQWSRTCQTYGTHISNVLDMSLTRTAGQTFYVYGGNTYVMCLQCPCDVGAGNMPGTSRMKAPCIASGTPRSHIENAVNIPLMFTFQLCKPHGLYIQKVYNMFWTCPVREHLEVHRENIFNIPLMFGRRRY